MHLTVDGDRFGFDLTPNLSVFTDCQNAVRVDVAFDFAVNEQFFLELDRAFDFDIAREDVFASVVCHRIRFWIWIIDYGWFWCCLFATRKMLGLLWNRIPRFFSNRGCRPLRDESFEHLVVMSPSRMPLNGFSFMSEKFFTVSSSDFHSIKFACWVLRKKNQ